MTQKKEKLEVNETIEVNEYPKTEETPVKHGPRDYLVKASELLKECCDTRNIKVAQNAIEEALLFIGKEGL